jgi:hypothetical protein
MGSNMVPLSAGRAAVLPVAGKAEVVGGFATDVVVAEVVVESLGVAKRSTARLPLTWERVRARGLPVRCLGGAVVLLRRRGSRRGRRLG